MNNFENFFKFTKNDIYQLDIVVLRNKKAIIHQKYNI